MIVKCICKNEFEAEPKAENGWIVNCPNCGASICVHMPGVSRKEYRKAVLNAEGRTGEHISDDAIDIAKKVRVVEVLSCLLWMVLGIVQIILLYTAAAGIWNIINGVIGLVYTKNIQAGNPNVPPYFEQRKTSLIIFAVVNLVLGGVIGIVLVLVEWLNRDYVLKHKDAFETAGNGNTTDPAALAENKQQPSGKNFCSNCGATLVSGVHFCSNCGAKV